MCWVMPPASPETTLVLRIASSSEVLPWSTWPMMVTTGGRGLQVALVLAGGLDDHVLDVGLRDAHHLVAELLDDQRRGVGVDGLVLRRHDAVLHQRLDHGGDPLGHAVGELLHGDRVGDVDLAHHLLALAGVARPCGACRAPGGASSRPASAGGPPRRWRWRWSACPSGGGRPRPWPRPRFSSAAGALSATFFGPAGRPASARAAWACAAAGSTRLGRGARRGCRRRLARWRGAWRRLGLGLGGGRGGALLLDLALLLGALGGVLLGAQPGQLGLAGLGRPRAPSGGARPPAPWRPRPPSAAARTRRPTGWAWCRAGRVAGAAGGRAGLGDQNALALVLDRDRLGPAVAEALAHMAGLGAAAAQPERSCPCGRCPWYPSFRSSLSRGGLPPPIHRRPPSRRRTAGSSHP